ncbi:peptide/nickel transport system permease protein [Novimethylophilus kurashikiensis]|uniref:Peptide/nickel transport system permease protein n=1 Tax=Novimethylophilus kurashikiensis TaxID=1825523 RepID=A0A2R5F1G2_9PROT|nr:nickel ABC transporter permease [Novimethylophilus kurashikiensis]GBG12556.1 peptide/nickel transport system permease protein [Novimethylophilus kurashikiensis]
MNSFLKRLLGVIPVVFGVLLLTFLLVHLVPGDPVEVMLGESATTADRTQLRAELGLDQPLPIQFVTYLGKLAQGNFGYSIHTHTPISRLLAERLPATVELALLALSIALFIGLPLGIVAAIRYRQWPDKMATVSALTLSAMPHFWLGPLLMLVFALWLGWLPVNGMESRASIVLPALTLACGLTAILTRMTRASLLEVLSEDFVRTARAKGLSQRVVVLRHALKAALLPVVTIVGLQLGSLLAGAVITETVFGWDGVGRLLVESIEKRDYPVTQACVLVIALIYVLVNLLTDLTYARLDPRVRFTR